MQKLEMDPPINFVPQVETHENPSLFDNISHPAAANYEATRQPLKPVFDGISQPISVHGELMSEYSEAQNMAFGLFEFLKNEIRKDSDTKVLIPGILRVRKSFPLSGEEAQASFLLVEGDGEAEERVIAHVGRLRSSLEMSWRSALVKEPIHVVDETDEEGIRKLRNAKYFPFVVRENVGPMRIEDVISHPSREDTRFYKTVTEAAFGKEVKIDTVIKL